MSRYTVEVSVRLKPELSDIQGQAVHAALSEMGYAGVASVSTGRLYSLELEAASREEAERTAEEICAKILRNSVIETSTAVCVSEGQ